MEIALENLYESSRLELVGGRAEEICPADNRIEVTAHT